MKIIDLTPDRIQYYDPTGRGRAHLQRMKHPTEYAPIPSVIITDDYLTRYKELRAREYTARHAKYWAFDAGYDSKYGPQGNTIALKDLLLKLEEFYKNGRIKASSAIVQRGLDFFLMYLEDKIQMYGYPIAVSRTGYYDTCAGLPAMGSKRAFSARFGDRNIMYPDLLGQRGMRNSNRLIHMDSNHNVERWDCEMAGIRNWLKLVMPEFFSAWINPEYYLQPTVTRSLGKSCFSCEADYEHCDEHTSLDLVEKYVLPIYDKLLPEPVFIEFADYVRELFNLPVFMGDKLITGQHTLFSGQLPTNDFETIFDVVLHLGLLLHLNRYSDLAYLLANGDDMAVGMNCTRAQADYYNQLTAEVAAACGHVMQSQKIRVGWRDLQFCKKIYYPGLPTHINADGNVSIYGAYPGILTLNSIVNPERVIRDEAEQYKAILQRLDNHYGAPDFVPFVQMVATWLKRPAVTINDIATAKSYDWWERVYGETWTLRDSPSYKCLVRSNPGFFAK